jgi:hypothetical protein
MMVYDALNYWIIGLCPTSRILHTRKHSDLEAISVSFLGLGRERRERERERETYSVGHLRKS